MKSKESRLEMKAPVLDVSERLRELQAMRAEVAVLRDQLFQGCCRLQHDETSIDAAELGSLAFRLRTLEEQREDLETTLATLLMARAAEG
jgi:hypothetical protein